MTFLRIQRFWAHLQAQRNLGRYLIGPSLPPRAQRLVAEHLQECPACRQRLDQLHQSLQQIAGVRIERSTAWQREALFERIWSDVQPVESEAMRATPATVDSPTRFGSALVPTWRMGLVSAAALATVAALYLAWPSMIAPDGQPNEVTTIRGGYQQLPDAALGFSGVDAAGAEYEVVESEGICPDDALRVYARVRNQDFRYVAVFAVQEDATELTWYFPSQEEQTSYEVPQSDAPWSFPDEIPIAPNHHAGPVLVVGVFSNVPLSVAELESEWNALAHARPRDSVFAVTVGLLERWNQRDYLAQGTAIQILDTCSGGRP